MKSVFRVWRRRNSSKTSIDEDAHIPVQRATSSSKVFAPSPSPPPSYNGPSPPRPARPDAPSLDPPVFRDCFSHSIEEALQYNGGKPQHASGNYPTTPRTATPRQNEFATLAHYPSPSHYTSNGHSLSKHHGPRDTIHGRAGLTPTQSSQIPSSKTDPNSATRTNSTPSRSQIRSPTHVNFDMPVDPLEAGTQRSQFSFSRAPSSADSPEDGQGSRRVSPFPESRTRTSQDSPTPRTSQRRGSKDELSSMPSNAHPGPLHVDTTDPRTRRGLATTRSTPHLRPNAEYLPSNEPLPPLPIPSPSDPNFVSYFPSPPPLIIRKKRPQPLVLNPQARALPTPHATSPNASSTDSTPVATPQSSTLQFPTSPTPPAKISRKSSVIPPLIHSPPTSPLPSPPAHTSSTPMSPPPRRTVHSFHSSASQLKPSRSAINLRTEKAPPSVPTHRMTSSDPIAEVSGQATAHRTGSPLKLDQNSHNSSRRFVSVARLRSSLDPPLTWVLSQDRREDVAVASSQEGAVQWGYAL
ncbi:hypothetical protein NMY22_g2485 [Coprinellus aureogranulatus]|nr:hypothetical protein NMY22_g2485 [Coprinellus aureogranulatus]